MRLDVLLYISMNAEKIKTIKEENSSKMVKLLFFLLQAVWLARCEELRPLLKHLNQTGILLIDFKLPARYFPESNSDILGKSFFNSAKQSVLNEPEENQILKKNGKTKNYGIPGTRDRYKRETRTKNNNDLNNSEEKEIQNEKISENQSSNIGMDILSSVIGDKDNDDSNDDFKATADPNFVSSFASSLLLPPLIDSKNSSEENGTETEETPREEVTTMGNEKAMPLGDNNQQMALQHQPAQISWRGVQKNLQRYFRYMEKVMGKKVFRRKYEEFLDAMITFMEEMRFDMAVVSNAIQKDLLRDPVISNRMHLFPGEKSTQISRKMANIALDNVGKVLNEWGRRWIKKMIDSGWLTIFKL